MPKSLSRNFLLILGLVLGSVVTTQSDFGQEASAIRIAKLARASTVSIETNKGSGTGFVIADEFVATNHHVVEEASKISVHLVGHNESLRATLFADDKDN